MTDPAAREKYVPTPEERIQSLEQLLASALKRIAQLEDYTGKNLVSIESRVFKLEGKTT